MLDPLAIDLAHAKDAHRLQAAAHARRLRDCRPAAPRRAASWSLLSLAVVLGLALGLGTVVAGRAGEREERGLQQAVTVLAGCAEPGAVVAGEAQAAGMSVAAVVRVSGPEALPVPGPGAPGQESPAASSSQG